MKVVRVTYKHDRNYHATGGMINAGKPPVTAKKTEDGNLKLKGPQIDYTLERVEDFYLEEVDI